LAEQSFKKAIELDPTNAEAYYQFGVTQMQKATIGKDNKVSAPAGTEEAFQKYLALKPAGPDADAAKAMLDSMGATVKTTLDKKGKGGK
jgi:cytochrome c-type biogenesis protein CcmH/NrfG